MTRYDTTNGWIYNDDGTKQKWFDSITLKGHPQTGARIWPGKFVKENLMSTIKKAFKCFSKLNTMDYTKSESRFVATATLFRAFDLYFQITQLKPTSQGQKCVFNIQGTKFVFQNSAEYQSELTWNFIEIEKPDTITITIQ